MQRKYYRNVRSLAGCLIAAAPPLSVGQEAGYIRAATYIECLGI